MSEVLTKREQLLAAVKKVGVKEAVRRIIEDIDVPPWIRDIAAREGKPIYARWVYEDDGHYWTYQIHPPEECWLRWIVVYPRSEGMSE